MGEFRFQGFSKPTYTIVPDEVFDQLMPHLKEAELRVLLYIIRRTFGFDKDKDSISLRQMTEGIRSKDGRVLDHGTGMSRKAVISGTRGLVEKGIISVRKKTSPENGSETNIYRLRFKGEEYAPEVIGE